MRSAYGPIWVLAFAAALFAFGSAHAQNQKLSCPSNLKKNHPEMPFDFDTSTSVAPAALYVASNTGPYQMVVFTCVGNNDSKGLLQFDWLTPRHHGWLEPGRISTSPRLVRGNSPTPYDGCLRFGNKGDSIQAQFFGGDDDRAGIEAEHKVGCRTAIARGTAGTGGGGIFDFLLPFRNSFPSDSNKPNETMMQISGQVGIQKIGSDRYSSLLQYAINPSSESAGKASSARLRPAFRGAGEKFVGAYREKNPEQMPLASSGTVRFEVANVGNASLIYEAYEILDSEGKVVASIAVPLFAPSER